MTLCNRINAPCVGLMRLAKDVALFKADGKHAWQVGKVLAFALG